MKNAIQSPVFSTASGGPRRPGASAAAGERATWGAASYGSREEVDELPQKLMRACRRRHGSVEEEARLWPSAERPLWPCVAQETDPLLGISANRSSGEVKSTPHHFPWGIQSEKKRGRRCHRRLATKTTRTRQEDRPPPTPELHRTRPHLGRATPCSRRRGRRAAGHLPLATKAGQEHLRHAARCFASAIPLASMAGRDGCESIAPERLKTGNHLNFIL